MKTVANFAVRCINNGFSRRFDSPSCIFRALSTHAPSGGGIDDNRSSNNSFESTDDFEHRIFGGMSGSSASTYSFFQKLDRLEKARLRPGSRMGEGDSSHTLDGLDESFNSLSDGLDGKLKKQATYFQFDEEEIAKDDYSFRPDMRFHPESTYTTKDLDLTKPGVSKPPKRYQFEVTTEEVLRKADFRNVRFLANFITEAGIIIKRSKTGISAKAQRKIAREIKTARAFGLMPFTTMGKKSFVFGKTMEALDKDYEYLNYDNPIVEDADRNDSF